MPELCEELTGDGERLALVARLDDLEQVASGLGGEGLEAEIVEGEELDALEASEQAGVPGKTRSTPATDARFLPGRPPGRTATRIEPNQPAVGNAQQ